MNASLAAAVLAAGIILTPTAAWADEPPPPAAELEPWTAEDPGEPYLDCVSGTWLVDVTHYFAEQLEPGVWADPTVTVMVGEFYGMATGDSADSDCPNWVTDDEGTWSNTTAEVFPPALPLDPLPTVVDELEKVGLAILWKELG